MTTTTINQWLARYTVRPAGDLGWCVVDRVYHRSVLGWFEDRGEALRARINYAIDQDNGRSEAIARGDGHQDESSRRRLGWARRAADSFWRWLLEPAVLLGGCAIVWATVLWVILWSL